jgi:hypothetical protein
MTAVQLGSVSWERMIHAVEKVRERILRAAAALEVAGIPYAVVDGNAAAAWVSRVDESAVRNTRDVDILLRRAASTLPGPLSARRRSCTGTSPASTCSSMAPRREHAPPFA